MTRRSIIIDTKSEQKDKPTIVKNNRGKSDEMRLPRMRRLVRLLIVIVFFLFVVLNMHILLSFEPDLPDKGYRHPDIDSRIIKRPHVQFSDYGKRTLKNSSGDSSTFIIKPSIDNKTETKIRTTVIDNENRTQVKIEIAKINSEQYIRNLKKFGIKLTDDSVVIVLQVHDRVEYLKILLESLKLVKNIEKSLLIVSHDVYSAEMNKLVAQVDFCPVLQIFFPFSLQLHPNDFPGEDPNDCPRNMKKEEAVKTKCKNAAFPDKYGHYREAKYCQTKHHWWWKLHHVFDELTVMSNYNGLVLLLEEDYYVTPDVITILQMMHNLKNKDCKDCKMLAAGNYDKVQNFAANAGKVEVANWISSRHNMGMTFTADLWKQMKACGKEFCNFDDYNWDWTLQHLSSKCIPNQVKVLKMKATRVFHMGECGVHHKGKNCQPEEKKKTVQKMIDTNRQHLFPNTITIGSYSGLKLRDPKPNGGWGDFRDRQMCMSFINNSSSGVV